MDQPINLSSLSDQELLDGLRQNEDRFWKLVYSRYRTKIVNFLMKKGATKEVAFSIYQDTMVFLDQKKDKLLLTSTLSGYLTGVALKKLLEYWREITANTNTFVDIDRPDLAEELLKDDEDYALLLGVDDKQLFGLEAVEPDFIVQQMLKQLTFKHCKDIFTLRFWHGLDDKQIASRLNIAHGTVRNQLLNCKQQAKEILLQLGWQG